MGIVAMVSVLFYELELLKMKEALRPSVSVRDEEEEGVFLVPVLRHHHRYVPLQRLPLRRPILPGLHRRSRCRHVVLLSRLQSVGIRGHLRLGGLPPAQVEISVRLPWIGGRGGSHESGAAAVP